MSPKELRRAGQRLFGADWQSPLARTLGIHRTTVWRWLAGKVPVPEDHTLTITTLLLKKRHG